MDFLPTHRVYGYNTFEQILMVLLTGITNFGGIPSIIIMFKMKRYFQAHIGFFTIFTSFMYHSLDSVDGELYLNAGSWHRLDNIGAITGFMMLFCNLVDHQNHELNINLNMIALFIAILAQEKDPWNLNYTLVPITLSIIVFLISTRHKKRRPAYNKEMLGKGIFWILVAAVNFALGLDEFKDYLRFYHGLWHLCVGMSSFYFWQVNVRPGEEFTWSNFLKKKYRSDMEIGYKTE